MSLRPNGAEEPVTQGRGRLIHYSAATRGAWAAAFVMGGLVGGLVFIVVPVLHLCTTWALPLLGILAGVRAWAAEVALRQIEGPCPHCGQTTRLEGGSGVGPHVDNCTDCKKQVEATLLEAPAPA